MSRHAGCNDHLAKPISKNTLMSNIEKYAGPRSLLETPELESPDPIKIEPPRGLEKIVPGYLAARHQELPAMIALLAASEFERIAFLGHNLKGTGASYGFTDITRIGSALEQCAKESDSAGVKVQLTELGDYLCRIRLVANV